MDVVNGTVDAVNSTDNSTDKIGDTDDKRDVIDRTINRNRTASWQGLKIFTASTVGTDDDLTTRSGLVKVNDRVRSSSPPIEYRDWVGTGKVKVYGSNYSIEWDNGKKTESILLGELMAIG